MTVVAEALDVDWEMEGTQVPVASQLPLCPFLMHAITVEPVFTTEAGHTPLLPVHWRELALKHSGLEGVAQTVEELAKASAGHPTETPSHVSTTSHIETAGRQTEVL